MKTEINSCELRPNQPMSTTVEINDVPLDLKTAPTPTPLERTATSLQNLRSGLVQSESSKKLKAALTIKRKKKAGSSFYSFVESGECCWFIYLVIMTAGVLAPGPIFLSIYNGNDGPNAPCSTGATQWLHEIAVMATVFTVFLVLTILGGFWGGRIKSWLWNRVPEDKRDCAKTTGLLLMCPGLLLMLAAMASPLYLFIQGIGLTRRLEHPTRPVPRSSRLTLRAACASVFHPGRQRGVGESPVQ